LLTRKSISTGRDQETPKPAGPGPWGNLPSVTSFQQQQHTPFLSRAALEGFTRTRSGYIQKTSISAAQEREGRVGVQPQQSRHSQVLEHMIHEEKWSEFMPLGTTNRC